MTSDDKLAKEIYGKNAETMICKYLVFAPRKVDDFQQHLIGGVGLSRDQKTDKKNGNDFELWEGRIIFVPRRKHIVPVRFQAYDLAQLLTGGGLDPETYKHHLEFQDREN